MFDSSGKGINIQEIFTEDELSDLSENHYYAIMYAIKLPDLSKRYSPAEFKEKLLKLPSGAISAFSDPDSDEILASFSKIGLNWDQILELSGVAYAALSNDTVKYLLHENVLKLAQVIGLKSQYSLPVLSNKNLEKLLMVGDLNLEDVLAIDDEEKASEINDQIEFWVQISNSNKKNLYDGKVKNAPRTEPLVFSSAASQKTSAGAGSAHESPEAST